MKILTIARIQYRPKHYQKYSYHITIKNIDTVTSYKKEKFHPIEKQGEFMRSYILQQGMKKYTGIVQLVRVCAGGKKARQVE